jgi:hypothetical protein
MNQTFLRLLFFFFLVNSASANNMLVQNVTTTGNNAVNKTIQVQFDISWDNSWRDAINWDAAWIFMKYKDANGLWQHCKLNLTGFANGTGTANTLQVTSDNIGSWLYRSAQGSGTFNSTGMQLQWNYGLSGLTDVTGLEVRVFAVEVVYVPEGDYLIQGSFPGSNEFIGVSAPAGIYPVINSRLSPTISISGSFGVKNIRVKGDAGIDFTNDGIIDNVEFPTGYDAFYCLKDAISSQQYADFLNCLTAPQQESIGLGGQVLYDYSYCNGDIFLNNNVYYSSNPNSEYRCGTDAQFLFFADWACLRPMSFFELNKLAFGPFPSYLNECPQPYAGGYSYYGIKNIFEYLNGIPGISVGGGLYEPVIIEFDEISFSKNNGDGNVNESLSYPEGWLVENVKFLHTRFCVQESTINTFRYVRSAE